MDLLGTGAINREYGITRVQIFKLIEGGQWPKPAGETGNGRVWTRRAVERAIERLEKSGRLTTLGNGRRVLVPTRLTLAR
jgi:hypothetical protein